MQETKNLGAVEFLEKPIDDLERLLEVVRKTLSGSVQQVTKRHDGEER